MPYAADLLLLDLLARDGYEPTPYNLRLVAQAFELGRAWQRARDEMAAEKVSG